MKKVVFSILLLSVLLSGGPAYATQNTYYVYDDKHRITEIWKERDSLIIIYSPDWKIQGFIKKGKTPKETSFIYDKTWKLKDKVEKR